MKTNKNVIRIMVPMLVVLCVVGVWLIKNKQREPATIKGNVASELPNEEGGLTNEKSERPNEESALPFEVTSINMEEINSHGLPIMIDFGAEECGPCQIMAPDLAKTYEAMKGRAVVRFVDVWKHPEAAENFPVQVVPTQFFINADGSPYKPDESVLEAIPNFQLYKSKSTGEHLFTVHQGGLTQDEMNNILIDMGVRE